MSEKPALDAGSMALIEAWMDADAGFPWPPAVEATREVLRALADDPAVTAGLAEAMATRAPCNGYGDGHIQELPYEPDICHLCDAQAVQDWLREQAGE